MNLTNLVRLCGAVALAWVLLAMGVGMYGINLRPLRGGELLPWPSPQITRRSRSHRESSPAWRSIGWSIDRPDGPSRSRFPTMSAGAA